MAVTVGMAYVARSGTADTGGATVLLPIPAAIHQGLSDVAMQHPLASNASDLLKLTARVNPALLHAAALQTVSPFRLADPGDAAHDLDCLTAAVYYEARGESREGQAAVAQVVLNRVRSPAFPKTVCSVVYQGAAQHSCQFSFACNGQMAARHESAAWERSRAVAGRALGGYVMGQVGGATHFHVATLGALWNGSMVEVARVGQHIFYGFGGHRGALASDMVAHNSQAPDSRVTDAGAPDAAVALPAKALIQPVSVKPAEAPAPVTPPAKVAVTEKTQLVVASPTAS
jgi:spore germination cell wall hydrolase CwlJ-like protein